MKKHIFVIAVVMLLGNVVAAFDYEAYSADEIYSQIERKEQRADYKEVRDSAEFFVAHFPLDERIDAVRLKLVSAYIDSRRFKLAATYIEQLRNSVLLKKTYHEDLSFYEIKLYVTKSKHWMAELFKMKQVYRNHGEIEKAVQQFETFATLYPRSQYLEPLREMLADTRFALANHELGIALHYAQKGNLDAASQRLDRYYAGYADIDTPLLEKVLSYLEG